MTVGAFLEKFDQLAEAPNAVEKMRELVLQLAVTGGLVPQDHNDPPASLLVERAYHEREALIRDGTISGPRTFRMGVELDRPSALPRNWVWTTLAEIALINPRNDAPDDIRATFISMSGIPDTYRGRFDGEIRPWADIRRQFTHFADGDIAMAKITPCFQNGKSMVLRGLENGIGAGTTELHVARPLANALVPEYGWLFLRSPRFLTEGVSVMTGSAGQKRVPAWYFALRPFALPPFAEQQRIVAKVDELMVLCHRLEEQQQERDTRHVALTRASLARFAEAPTPANLTFLFHKSYTVPPGDLRKSILTLAVQGKLVPRDMDDDLLHESFPGLRPHEEYSESRFDLPPNWAWCKYRQLTSLVTSGSRGWKEYYADSGAVFIRTQNIKTDRLVLEDLVYVQLPASVEGKRSRVRKDDILITITGANVTKAAHVQQELPEAYISQHIALTRPRWTNMARWLHLCFLSPASARGTLEALAYGDKPGLNLNHIRDLLLPIPPLAEQHRILEKVDRMMTLVDELEATIRQSRSTATDLVQAAVEELVA